MSALGLGLQRDKTGGSTFLFSNTLYKGLLAKFYNDLDQSKTRGITQPSPLLTYQNQ